MTWRDLWIETTVDPMWDLLSTKIVHKQATTVVSQTEHRNEFDVQRVNERNELKQQRFHVLDEQYFVGA